MSWKCETPLFMGKDYMQRFHSFFIWLGFYMTTVPYQTHIKKEQLIIEYVGELIRPILCDPREKYYDSKVLFIRLVFIILCVQSLSTGNRYIHVSYWWSSSDRRHMYWKRSALRQSLLRCRLLCLWDRFKRTISYCSPTVLRESSRLKERRRLLSMRNVMCPPVTSLSMTIRWWLSFTRLRLKCKCLVAVSYRGEQGTMLLWRKELPRNHELIKDNVFDSCFVFMKENEMKGRRSSWYN